MRPNDVAGTAGRTEGRACDVQSGAIPWFVTVVLLAAGRAYAEPVHADLAAGMPAEEQAATGEAAAEGSELEASAEASDLAEAANHGGADHAACDSEIEPDRSIVPALSLIGAFAAAYFTGDPHPPRGGHTPPSTGLHLMVVEVGLETGVDPYFNLRAGFAFGLETFETDEFYAETVDLPAGFEVRVGQMLAPFGRSNQLHFDEWEFVDAPLPHQRFLSGDGLRAPSLELSWVAPIPFLLEVTGWVGMPGKTPPAGTTPDEKTFGKDRDYDFLYLGRIETRIPFSDSWSLLLGASAATGPAGQGAGTRSDLFGGDLLLRYKPAHSSSFFEFHLGVEGAYRQRQFPANRLVDWALATEMALQLGEHWRIALRGDMARGDLTRGDTMTGPPLDFGEERGSLAVTCLPTEFSQLRLQGTLSHPHGPAWNGPHLGGELFLQAIFTIGTNETHRH